MALIKQQEREVRGRTSRPLSTLEEVEAEGDQESHQATEENRRTLEGVCSFEVAARDDRNDRGKSGNWTARQEVLDKGGARSGSKGGCKRIGAGL